MASFKAKFPVFHELFVKNHRGPLAPPAGRGLNKYELYGMYVVFLWSAIMEEGVITEHLDWCSISV